MSPRMIRRSELCLALVFSTLALGAPLEAGAQSYPRAQRVVRAPDYLRPEHVGLYLGADFRPLPGASAHHARERDVRVVRDAGRRLIWERVSAVDARAHARVWQARPFAPDPDDDLDSDEQERWAVWRLAEVTEHRAFILRDVAAVPRDAAWQIVEISSGRMIEARFRRRERRSLSFGRAPIGGSVGAWAQSNECEHAIDLLGLRWRENGPRDLPFAGSILELAEFFEVLETRPILVGLRRVRPGRRRSTPGLPPLPPRVHFTLERVELPPGLEPHCANGSMTPAAADPDTMIVSRPYVALFDDALQAREPLALYWRRGRTRPWYVRDLVRMFPARAGYPAGMPLGVRASDDSPTIFAVVFDRMSPQCGGWSLEEALESIAVRDEDVRRALDRLDGVVEISTGSGVRVRVLISPARGRS